MCLLWTYVCLFIILIINSQAVIVAIESIRKIQGILSLYLNIVQTSCRSMDVESRYTFLREKLHDMGFTQPLPIGSLAVVSALLDDLILTNKNLKNAKKKISELEKVMFEVKNYGIAY